MPMTYRAVTCNAFGPGSRAANEATIKRAAMSADVLLIQEADADVHGALRALGLQWDFKIHRGVPSLNPIAWRTNVMELLDTGFWIIYENKPGIKDGPDRSATWALFREKATDRKVIHIDVHMIHQAWTRHRERQAGWLASLVELSKLVRFLQNKYPGIPIVIAGDWNPPAAEIDIPDVLDREIKSPNTYGSKRYDRFVVVGNVDCDTPVAFNTPSDHHSLKTNVTLGAQTPPAHQHPSEAPAEPETPTAPETPTKIDNNVASARLVFGGILASWDAANGILELVPKDRTSVRNFLKVSIKSRSDFEAQLRKLPIR